MLIDFPEEIQVTIPAQEYDEEKYVGYENLCYLEEALIKKGFISDVSAIGSTHIYIGDDSMRYTPKKQFGENIVKTSFASRKPVHVTLIRQ